jgi:CspA family cold shock protein
LATGRILQFAQARGYGFVEADDDGEDVFLHASVFDGDTEELVPGTKVEFKIMAGDRGRKAFAARLADDEPEDDRVPPPQLVSPSRPAAGPRPVPAPLPLPSPAPAPPAPSSPAVQASAAPAPRAQGKDQADQAPDGEQMCDVLSPAELVQEITEVLLGGAPSLTGQQVLEVRQSLLESARKHGWVDV